MKEIIRKKTAASPVLRWTVVGLVSFTMLTGYVIADVMAPLKTLLEQQLGWDSSDYGLFTSGYGWLNIFLLMLIFGGMILDKKGVRYAGVLSVGLMIGGTLLKYWQSLPTSAERSRRFRSEGIRFSRSNRRCCTRRSDSPFSASASK